MTMIHGKNFIGNEISGKGDITYRTFNPILNKENEHVFFDAAPEEIEAAATLASIAFDSYRKTSGKERSNFLNAIAEEIQSLGDVLIQTYCSETGLPQGRAEGERGRAIGQLRAFADLVQEGSWVEATIDTAQPDRQPMPRSDIRKIMVPVGPVVVFGASNFPFAFSTAGGDTASALAAGCPVIVKSHPMHAGTGELVASAIIKAAEKTGMPNGVFSNLNSKGIEVGIHLVKHPLVKAVGFTGSLNGGRALFDLAAKRKEPIPVFAEMGSINPVVALPKALEYKGGQWAEAYANSITLGSGQFCTNPGLVLGLEGAELDNFVDELSARILEKEPAVMLHPNISETFDKNKARAMSQSETEVVAHYNQKVQANFAKQAVLSVEGDLFLENPTLHQEVFGPYSLVVKCRDEKQLIQILKNLEGQLTGTILAEEGEIKNYSGVIDGLRNRVGRLIFNGVPTGVEVCPAMQHGGPFPASTDSRFTSVGVDAIKRWVRPVSYQDWPEDLLPYELKNGNPLQILRKVDGEHTKKGL